MYGLVVHVPDNLGSQVLGPARVEIHCSEVAKRLDVDYRGDHGVRPGCRVRNHITVVVDYVGVPARDVDRSAHLRVQVYGANVWTDHVDTVELSVASVLGHPATATRVRA